MKKSLLFLALPLVMTLASCGSESKANFKAIQEDTLAHEEIFGKASAFKAFSPTKRGVVAPSEPRIGVQSYSDSTYYYLRFIAEVDNISDLEKLTWHVNAFSSGDGSSIRAEKSLTPSGYYTEVSNGGDVWTAEEGKGLFVYTILNIPKSNEEDYITATVDLENSMAHYYSDVCVTSINEETQFSLSRGDQGYFALIYKADGSVSKVSADNDKGGNHAQFVTHTLSLKEGEKFLIINRRDNETKGLQVYGYNNALKDKQRFYHDNNSNFVRSNFDGVFKVYLNSDDEIWINSDYNLQKYVYIDPNKNIEWLKDENYIALYTFYTDGSGDHELSWYKFTLDETSGYYRTTVSVSYDKLLRIIFARIDKNYDTPSWDHDFNQTGNLDLHTYIPSNLYTPTSRDGGDGKTVGTWSTYIPD